MQMYIIFDFEVLIHINPVQKSISLGLKVKLKVKK